LSSQVLDHGGIYLHHPFTQVASSCQ